MGEQYKVNGFDLSGSNVPNGEPIPVASNGPETADILTVAGMPAGYSALLLCRWHYPFSSFLDQRSHLLWLRDVYRMTALYLDNRRTRALGHGVLGRQWDHGRVAR